MKLSDRKKEILREVVLKFVNSAEPVSSQNIACNAMLSLSPATIRKEMAELEEMGYLNHPHTSAGRVPSDKGYRFFVDNYIKKNSTLTYDNKSNENEITKADISREINKDMEFETILKKSSEQLSKMTSYLSMIVSPLIFNSRFRHIELLELSKGYMLVVLITDAGRIFKGNFMIEGSYNYLDFQSTTNIINSNLRSRHLSEIELSNIKVSENSIYLIPVIKKVIETLKSSITETVGYNRIYIHGASSILKQPDFFDIGKIHAILKIIENEYMLANLLLNLSDDDDMVIKIGSEISEEGTDDLSLVASRYRINDRPYGTIGVLGPKRMDYIRVINIINAFIQNFSEIFS
jgi:heat-inducible transcriptional repressor